MLPVSNRVLDEPSVVPSGCTPGVSKIRSAELLLELGHMYRLQDNGAMAESYYRSVLEVASRTNDHAATAYALAGLGHIYCIQSSNKEAEKAFTEAYQIHALIGNDLGGT